MTMAEAGGTAFTWNLWSDLHGMLQYDFMRHALLAGTVVGVVAGLVGFFMVLRHQTFAGEALADVSFTGAMGGAALGINPLAGMIAMTLVVALAMGSFAKDAGERDVAIGTVLAWVLGLGVLFLYLFTRHHSGTGSGFSGVTVLFGSILSVSAAKTAVLAGIGAGIVAAMLAIARPLLFASLAPDVAAARRIPVRVLELAFLAIVAITVAETVQAVGALLVFALLLLPAATVQSLTPRPWLGLALSPLLAVAVTVVGLTIGFYSGAPSSVCISLLAVGVYVAAAGGRTSLRLFPRRRERASG